MNLGFDYDLEIEGRVIEAYVECEANVYTDHYGADADGRRGEDRTYIDDLVVTISDSRGNNIGPKLEKKYPYEWQLLGEHCEEKLYSAYEEEKNGGW